MNHVATIGDGRIVLQQATCAFYLVGASSAALVERDGQAFLLPLNGPVAGGLLLKQCNRAGDCVLLAEEFLGARGLGRFSADRPFGLRWVDEAGGLLIEGLGQAAA